MNIGDMVQSYAIIAIANGYVMGKSPTAPSPYGVWKIDNDGKGVCCGHYFVDREEAEWDFCASAFDWFEDNMYIHVITDSVADQTFDRALTDGMKEIRTVLAKAAQLVDEMCAEMDKLKGGRADDNTEY